MTNFLRETGLDKFRNTKVAAVGAILATMALASCGSEKGEAPPVSPVVAASPDVSPTTTPDTTVPEINLEATGFTSIAEAVSALESSPNAENQPLSDNKPLLDALSGDLTLLNKMHITIQDLSINYALNELYLKELKPLVKDLKTEQEAWNSLKGGPAGSPASEYEDTKAIQFLLGTLINDYTSGKSDIAEVDDWCPEPDMNDIDWDGGYASAFLPPLGFFMYSTKLSTCPNPGKITSLALDAILATPFAIKGSLTSNLPKNAEAFQIKSDILNLSDSKAKKIITTYTS